MITQPDVSGEQGQALLWTTSGRPLVVSCRGRPADTAVMKRALVLAGGGVAGIAWELGLLDGLACSGIDVTDADLLIGTSAGSEVGAQILSGTPLGELVERQIDPPEGDEEVAVAFDLAAFMEAMAAAAAAATGPQDYRARIGAMARASTPAPAEESRRQRIATRLPVLEWPARPLLITAVDADSGESVVFDRDAGVELVDAIAASCAVPCLWPPVTIGSRRFIDGGVRSLANADLASDCAAVLVVAPFNPASGGQAPTPSEEVAYLARRTAALLVDGGDAFMQAAGTNPLHPATREPAALSGRQRGTEVSDRVRALWDPTRA
ncbi:MAG: Patatin [Frankiales bacterium]|nr:Patatin [Frankiales bacterium]